MMQEMHEQLAPSLGHQVLIQGGAPKQVLIDEFKRDVHSILFATRSFWQGIDVVGESLSLVIIDRIPFPTPDNPIMQARKERMGGGFESFLKVDLPYATCLLAQGMGRLIRSSDDRGVVAVLDPRLAEAKYKSHILDHLPGMRRVRDFAIVETFFKESE
jgi:ATP-dependent DNA helicase DinG